MDFRLILRLKFSLFEEGFFRIFGYKTDSKECLQSGLGGAYKGVKRAVFLLCKHFYPIFKFFINFKIKFKSKRAVISIFALKKKKIR